MHIYESLKKILIATSALVALVLLGAGCDSQSSGQTATNVSEIEAVAIEHKNTSVENIDVTEDTSNDTVLEETTNGANSVAIDEKTNSNESNGGMSDWLTYKNEEYGFSLSYPKHWEYTEQKYECIDFISSELKDYNVKWAKKYPEAAKIGTDAVKTYDISVCFEENREDLTVDKWLEENVDFTEIVSQESITISGQPGVEVVKNVLGVWRETYATSNNGIIRILRLQEPVAVDSVFIEEVVSKIQFD